MTRSMPGLRRRKARRTVARLARVLASLDEQARVVRPAPRRTARVSLGG